MTHQSQIVAAHHPWRNWNGQPMWTLRKHLRRIALDAALVAAFVLTTSVLVR